MTTELARSRPDLHAPRYSRRARRFRAPRSRCSQVPVLTDAYLMNKHRRLTPAMRTICNTAEMTMVTRTVRFNEETEKTLNEVRAATGWPISEVLTRGLNELRAVLRTRPVQMPYDVYRELDLGPGGSAVGSSEDTRGAARQALKRKHGR